MHKNATSSEPNSQFTSDTDLNGIFRFSHSFGGLLVVLSVNEILTILFCLHLSRGQLSIFLHSMLNSSGCTLFHRRFPELCRRPIGSLERRYLIKEGILDESLQANCYGNLTAIIADEALHVMQSSFPEHYRQYRDYWLDETEKLRIRSYENFRPTCRGEPSTEKDKKSDSHQQESYFSTVKETAEFNRGLNQLRARNAAGSLDLQTMTVHIPREEAEISEIGQNVSSDFLSELRLIVQVFVFERLSSFW